MLLVDCNTLCEIEGDAEDVKLLSQLTAWTDVNSVSDTAHQRLHRLLEAGCLERCDDIPASDNCTAWDPFSLAVQRNITTDPHIRMHAPTGPAPAAFKTRRAGFVVELPPAPALDMTLGEALATRRSLRTYGSDPLTLRQVSGVLQYAARVLHVYKTEEWGEVVFRPTPSGGARSPLELYVVANRVAGIDPGTYLYDGLCHQLVQVRRRGEFDVRLAVGVNADTEFQLDRVPDAIIIITAIFARTLWKYGGLGISLVLRDAGCMLQSLYLTATALNLAPCAIGALDQLAVAEWLDEDPLIEAPVGCMLIATKPT
jgi:SagB-type dehydrogenase family enzyme